MNKAILESVCFNQGRSFGLNFGAAIEILVRQNGVIFGKIGFYCIFI